VDAQRLLPAEPEILRQMAEAARSAALRDPSARLVAQMPDLKVLMDLASRHARVRADFDRLTAQGFIDLVARMAALLPISPAVTMSGSSTLTVGGPVAATPFVTGDPVLDAEIATLPETARRNGVAGLSQCSCSLSSYSS
jgi:hypothetical protein